LFFIAVLIIQFNSTSCHVMSCLLGDIGLGLVLRAECGPAQRARMGRLPAQ
jgi:hypothetical protein